MKKLFIAFMLVCGFALAAPVTVLAADSPTDSAKESLCEGVGLTGGSCDEEGDDTVASVVKTVINILSWIVGIIAVIMIIIGGLKYITSSGESNNVNSAKNTILYAAIGLVVVLLAQVIVRFVIDKAGAPTEEEPVSSLVTTG